MSHRVASRRPRVTLWFLSAAAGSLAASLLLIKPAPAEQLARPPLPLPADEQAQVNGAIDRGVTFLRATQNAWGGWGAGKGPGPGGGHMIGYAALPGLTLLECGLPRDHSSVQRAAAVVRGSWSKIDTTYELALAILFLDRLGDPKDKALIETFALRLIAGQTPSGGWSYRCPTLGAARQRELLTVLRQLNPTAGFTLLPDELALLRPTNEEPRTLARLRPADPGPIERAKLKPGGERRQDLARFKTTDTPAAELSLTRPGPRSPGGLGATREGKDGESLWQSASRTGDEDSAAGVSGLTPRRGQCIKVAEGSPAEVEALPEGKERRGGDKGNAKDGGKGNDPKAANPPRAPDPAKVAIPAPLARLPVLQDPRRLGTWIDPLNQPDAPTWGTTDNSNTQFAILALWVARRHGIPMDRTAELMVRRFRISQNADSGWGYRYLPGGGVGSTPQMTCVGLIGLAVGHGLAPEGRPAAGARVQDPSVVNGFVALTRGIGDPAGRTVNLPMSNLYYLWSVERVAVLYNLRTVGNKDWYRWGAEILVANQGPHGGWQGGGYPGAHPVLDTCLALLFLRRANLAADLTARLPFKPEELSTDIGSAQAREQPPARTDPPGASGPGRVPTTSPDPPLLASVGSTPDKEEPAATAATALTLSRTGSDVPQDGESSGGRRWWLLILLVACVLLLGGGGAACWFGRSRSAEPAKRKGKKRAAGNSDKK